MAILSSCISNFISGVHMTISVQLIGETVFNHSYFAKYMKKSEIVIPPEMLQA